MSEMIALEVGTLFGNIMQNAFDAVKNLDGAWVDFSIINHQREVFLL